LLLVPFGEEGEVEFGFGAEELRMCDVMDGYYGHTVTSCSYSRFDSGA